MVLYISTKKLTNRYDKHKDNTKYKQWICIMLFFLNILSKFVDVIIQILKGINIQYKINLIQDTVNSIKESIEYLESLYDEIHD